jgi:DNA polymerase zeta
MYVSCKFTVAPNGIMYVKPEVRRGLLGRMLTELLDTRVMVKQAMKRAHDNKVRIAKLSYSSTSNLSLSQTLTKILDARQLGLKYIANVTYGYTSATFSGRMPAVEIADSIVQSGRETLEKVRWIRDVSTLECMPDGCFRQSSSSNRMRNGALVSFMVIRILCLST